MFSFSESLITNICAVSYKYFFMMWHLNGLREKKKSQNDHIAFFIHFAKYLKKCSLLYPILRGTNCTLQRKNKSCPHGLFKLRLPVKRHLQSLTYTSGLEFRDNSGNYPY